MGALVVTGAKRLQGDFYHYIYRKNSKKLWGMKNKIAGRSNDKSTVKSCIKVDSIEYYDAQSITNELGKYFADVGETYADKIGARCSSTLNK